MFVIINHIYWSCKHMTYIVSYLIHFLLMTKSRTETSSNHHKICLNISINHIHYSVWIDSFFSRQFGEKVEVADPCLIEISLVREVNNHGELHSVIKRQLPGVLDTNKSGENVNANKAIPFRNIQWTSIAGIDGNRRRRPIDRIRLGNVWNRP